MSWYGVRMIARAALIAAAATATAAASASAEAAGTAPLALQQPLTLPLTQMATQVVQAREAVVWAGVRAAVEAARMAAP